LEDFMKEDGMKHSLWRSVLPLVLTLSFLGTPAGAQQDAEKTDLKASTNKPEAGTSGTEIEQEAKEILTRWAEALAKTQRFSVTVETGYDAVQPSGQKVEFGATNTFTVSRPDHLRIDVNSRDGAERSFRFDGKEIAVFDKADKVYATAAKPGTFEAAVNYFIDEMQMPLPLSEIFSSTLPKLAQSVTSLNYVAEETIAGVRCDHVAGTRKHIDFQLWISQGDKPLLQRLIFTYKEEEGAPQRWAQFRDWNFSPEAPDSFFAFTPPEGFEKIPFAPLTKVAAEATK
jgi:hypothetical protein